MADPDAMVAYYRLIAAEGEEARAAWQAIKCARHLERPALYIRIGPRSGQFFRVLFVCRECKESVGHLGF
jgi:hypothetical protein